MKCHGVASVVVLGGNVVYENGVVSAGQGTGRFIETPCYSEYVYKRVLVKDNIKPGGVEREAYTGPVIDLSKDIETLLAESKLEAVGLQPGQTGQFHHRPPTKSGGRNMQDSSFSFSGNQFDDQPVRSSTRIRAPPGGKSSGIF
jgi:hypothetical protein